MGDEGSGDPKPAKRPRTTDLKRVAEIVMVLSAMGRMRGGKDPAAVEKAMAAEAREKLAEVCEEEMKPKDLISREAVRVLVEDLGLNRSRDPMMGFRPPKMSIADKLQLTKRKMEESKGFASHSSIYSSQHHLGGFGANSESHGTLSHGPPKFLSDRQSPMALSAGGFQSASPGINVSAVASATSSLKQSHVGEPQLTPSSIKSSATPVEKGSLLAQPHAEAPHLKFDTKFNGPSYSTQGQANSAEKIPATSVQSTPTAVVRTGQSNNLINAHVKPGGGPVNNIQTYHQLTGNQEAKTSAEVQPVNPSIGHQPVPGIVFVSGPSFVTTHEDISKAVQKLLQPKVFDHPNWAPPSTEYINQPLNCQMCKVPITDVESLLVCDACEKGTHLKCLQSYGNKEGVPKAEWHCPKCLIVSNGKPLPPKYGRVTRTIVPPPKAPSNTVAASPTTQKKPPDSKVDQQKLTANGTSNLPHHVNASSSTTNHSVLNPDVKSVCAGEIKPLVKSEGGMSTVPPSNISTGRAGVVCVTPSITTDNSDKEIKSCGSSSSDMHTGTSVTTQHQKIESEPSCPEHSNGPAAEIAVQSQASCESKVCKETKVPISIETSANQPQEVSKPCTDELKEPSFSQGPSQCEADCDVALNNQGNSAMVISSDINDSKKPSELIETSGDEATCNILIGVQDKGQDTPNGAFDNGDGSRDCGKHSPHGSYVHWIGDSLSVIDEKIYYQSCQINGVLHKLQDHVLISTDRQKIYPSKLQSLWEDNKTGCKWAVVNRCYYPNDLPEDASRPSTPETNEVYASNAGSTIMVNSVCGLCKVLSVNKFREEVGRRTHLGDVNSGLRPLFLCRWMYDESTGVFQSISD